MSRFGSSFWLLVAALNGFFVVAAGAFGAHALKTRLEPEQLVTYETAVRYQAYHTLALLFVALWAQSQSVPGLSWVGGFFLAGIVLFSGSLYALAFTRIRILGAVTPMGGLSFLAGWALLGWQAWRAGR